MVYIYVQLYGVLEVILIGGHSGNRDEIDEIELMRPYFLLQGYRDGFIGLP